MAKLTIPQFCKQYPFSKSFIYHAVAAREIPFVRAGARKILIDEEKFDSWLNSQAVKPREVK
jgi:excisionase family DNA binding protein